jgi:hypothetical protein
MRKSHVSVHDPDRSISDHVSPQVGDLSGVGVVASMVTRTVSTTARRR